MQLLHADSIDVCVNVFAYDVCMMLLLVLMYVHVWSWLVVCACMLLLRSCCLYVRDCVGKMLYTCASVADVHDVVHAPLMCIRFCGACACRDVAVIMCLWCCAPVISSKASSEHIQSSNRSRAQHAHKTHPCTHTQATRAQRRGGHAHKKVHPHTHTHKQQQTHTHTLAPSVAHKRQGGHLHAREQQQQQQHTLGLGIPWV